MAAVENLLNGDVNLYDRLGRMEADTIEILNEEIRNLENLIRLTKERLERLNAQFGRERHPPALYLQEYEELANKIHELQTQLQDKEQELTDIEAPPPKPPEPEPDPPTPVKLPIHTQIGNGTKTDTSVGGAGTEVPGALSSPNLAVKSPLGHVKAFLPNSQHTSVAVKVGKTLGEGLAKALKLRDFELDDCDVYDRRTGRQISWDEPMSEVAGYELTVELKLNRRQPSFPGVSYHNLARKTFFSLTFCDVCRKFLLQGFRCQTCGYRLHQRCKDNINPLCDTRNLTKHLLADSYGPFHPSLIPPSSYQSAALSQPPQQPFSRNKQAPLGPRGRSTSAPNVSFVNIGATEERVPRTVTLCIRISDTQVTAVPRRSQGLGGKSSRGIYCTCHGVLIIALLGAPQTAPPTPQRPQENSVHVLDQWKLTPAGELLILTEICRTNIIHVPLLIDSLSLNHIRYLVAHNMLVKALMTCRQY
ncbi:BRAF-like protein [Mya arenaria]|uniref:BRAF-like protein n=1 Tax=Mya arenaria TaxID=6604 RepID=A0ABY7G283_MYAAR|nr:BRAF-like protein [Mya arenaria]